MPLDEYRERRDFATTPEPDGETPAPDGERRFVIQEHHATALHWDLRLEHDGVLASWALPKGIPPTRARTGSPSAPRIIPWSTSSSRVRFRAASTAAG